MEHTLSRFEKILNENGSLKEVFITVKLRIDANEVWEQGYWLTPAELDLIALDESNLTPVIDAVAIKAEESYNNYINEPPIEEPVIEVPFNVNDFLFGLMVAFTPLMDYANILIFYPMVGDFARAENFEGMNMFLRGLIQNGIMSQEQFDTLNGVLLQQNIDLNNL